MPGFTYQLIARCLKDGVSSLITREPSIQRFSRQDDSALNHAACKIIENLLLIADKQADKLATLDIALALWNISAIVGNNEHVRASALAVRTTSYAYRWNERLSLFLGAMPYGRVLSRCASVGDR